MKKIYLSVLALIALSVGYSQDLLISGAYDGPLTGGTPKGIELYVLNNIADLSIYGIGSANNGTGTDGEEFTFPAVAATAGDYIYITTDSTKFYEFFSIAPDFISGSMAINGDDAVELFMNGAVVDLFGDINVDGSGTSWDYLDGWAYRMDGFGPSTTFTDSEWTYSGIDVFDGQTTNATSPTPFPIGTYAATLTPRVYFSIDSFEFNENAGTVNLGNLMIDPAIASAVAESFEVHLDAASTADQTDFVVNVVIPITLPLTYDMSSPIFPNFTSQALDVEIVEDTDVEGDEWFRVVLRNGMNGLSVGADSVLYVKIIDNDFPADTFVVLTSNTLTVNEDAGSFDIPLTYQQTAADANHTVQLLLDNGDAADVDNFMPLTATFNSLTEKFTVNITDDALVEGTEVLTFVLANATNGLVIGADSTFTLTITDNDYPYYSIDLLRGNDTDALADSLGVKCWTSGYILGENLSSSIEEFTIHNGVKGIGVYSTSGDFGYTVVEGDSVMVLGTVDQFGRLSQMSDVDSIYFVSASTIQTPTIITDTLGEYTESELVTIENAILTGGTWGDNQTITIEANGLEYTVRIDGETGVGTLAEPAGAFNITGVGSQYTNSTTSFFSGYQLKPRYVADIELLPSVGFNEQGSSVNEDAGTVTIDFSVANDDGGSYTVDVELTSGDAADLDGFTTLTAVTVTGGMGSFDVTITDDALVEGNEGFEFTLSNPSAGLSLGNANTYDLTVIDDETDAISEINVNALTVYPNPASEKVIVKMISNEKQIANITLVDVVGKTIQANTFMLNNGENAIELDLTSVANGNYMINISTENGSHTENVIVK